MDAFTGRKLVPRQGLGGCSAKLVQFILTRCNECDPVAAPATFSAGIQCFCKFPPAAGSGMGKGFLVCCDKTVDGLLGRIVNETLPA